MDTSDVVMLELSQDITQDITMLLMLARQIVKHSITNHPFSSSNCLADGGSEDRCS